MIVSTREAGAVAASRNLLSRKASSEKTAHLLALAKAKGEAWVADQLDRLTPAQLGLDAAAFACAASALKSAVRWS